MVGKSSSLLWILLFGLLFFEILFFFMFVFDCIFHEKDFLKGLMILSSLFELKWRLFVGRGRGCTREGADQVAVTLGTSSL